MQRFSLLRLYFIFFKIGAILLGGGYVILPILIDEFVKKRNLVTQEEIIDFFALSQSLPGIIAANISMFIGEKLGGRLGAFVAMLGIITAPFFVVISLASLLNVIANNIYVQAAFDGVSIAVITLILLTIKELWQNSIKDKFFYLIFCIALFLLIYGGLSPIMTIIFCVSFGIIFKYLFSKEDR